MSVSRILQVCPILRLRPISWVGGHDEAVPDRIFAGYGGCGGWSLLLFCLGHGAGGDLGPADARISLNAHIEKQTLPPPPVQPDEQNLLAGADVYTKHCAMCHGLPNQPKPVIQEGMYPPPTELFRGKGVTDDPPSESYWKSLNGIRLSGMPSFKSALTETQLWQVSLLVAHANDLPESVKKALVPPAAPSTPEPTSK
jgi:thiosulfate dehydrogenase